MRNALVRATIEKRFAAYGKAWWMTGNEIREKENQNDLPGMDKPQLAPPGAASPQQVTS